MLTTSLVLNNWAQVYPVSLNKEMMLQMSSCFTDFNGAVTSKVDYHKTLNELIALYDLRSNGPGQ